MIIDNEKIRLIKVGQLILVLLILILEIVQAVTYVEFLREVDRFLSIKSSTYDINPKFNPTNIYFTNSIDGKGISVIWVFVVVTSSLLGIIGYLALSNIIWKKRDRIAFIAFDAAFTLLWLTEVFTNLVWIYKEVDSPCHRLSIPQYSLYISLYFPELRTACGAYTASNIFGWFTLISFIVGTGVSLKTFNDEKLSAKTSIPASGGIMVCLDTVSIIQQNSPSQQEEPIQPEKAVLRSQQIHPPLEPLQSQQAHPPLEPL